MKIIIVGGVAGGASTATRLRRLDEKCEVVIYERDNYVSFANCGLPYHIGGVIEEKDALLLQTPEKLKARFNFDVKIKHEILSIDKENKKVKVKKLETEETFEDSYDYLVLSPGAAPLRPPIPGIDNENIYVLRNIPDMDKIIKAIKNDVKKAVVIGGGFIGVEVAENLIDKGIETSLVEMFDQVLTFLDPEIVSFAHEELKAHKLNLYLGDKAVEFKSKDKGLEVVLGSGKNLDADIVILSVGVKPEIKLAQEAGLKIGETGAIWVDDEMKTSDSNIFALGDAVEVTHFVTKTKTKIPLAWPANRQGRIVADNIVKEKKSKYVGTQGTSIVKVFDLICGSTGANTALLNRCNIPFQSVIVHRGSHAGYYPGSFPIHLKLLFSPEDGKVLGAQACGYDGVDKRIDVIATAIKHSATIYDLEDYELCYAPPFGSAKDPVNIAAFVAENHREGFAPLIDIFEAEKRLQEDAVLLDIRDDDETVCGVIKEAIVIPLNSLRERLEELPKDKTLIVYCKVGMRGYIAQRILLQNGFKCLNLSGGYDTYATYKGIVPPADINCAGVNISTDTCLKTESHIEANIKINACGLQCPGPLVKLKEAVTEAKEGDIISIEASDPGFYRDIQSFASTMNLKILELERGKIIKAKIQKLPEEEKKNITLNNSEQVTIVVFSGDFDKVMASLIISTGALAMGKKVSLFFTFWGLNALRKAGRVKVKKNFIEKMFGMMMPKGTKKLALSKMNMMGMGTKMIKGIMKKHNVSSMEELLKSVIAGGGKLIACSMSMNLMGIKKEELIEEVEEGGVAAYLGDAQKGTINLFI